MYSKQSLSSTSTKNVSKYRLTKSIALLGAWNLRAERLEFFTHPKRTFCRVFSNLSRSFRFCTVLFHVLCHFFLKRGMYRKLGYDIWTIIVRSRYQVAVALSIKTESNENIWSEYSQCFLFVTTFICSSETKPIEETDFENSMNRIFGKTTTCRVLQATSKSSAPRRMSFTHDLTFFINL